MSNISEVKFFKATTEGKRLGYGSFVLAGTARINYTLVQGEKTPFLGLPQSSYQKDGKTEYKKEVQFITREAADEALRAVLAARDGGSPSTGTSSSRSNSVDDDSLPF